jgi:Lrp/AsnC family transcriptional regulator, leucine-responsive regulatory protein
MRLMSKLDRFDRKLLEAVQLDASVTSETLASRIGLSPSAVQRRLKRLQAEGVIASIVAIVDPVKSGRSTLFIVGLEVERERPELLARLRAWLTAEPAVQQAFYVTGTWDFLLIVTAPDVASYDALISRLMADNPNVRRFTTNVVLGTHKRGLFVPVAAEEAS